MMRSVSKSLWLLFFAVVMVCGIYPAVLWGIGQTPWPFPVNGSIVNGPDGKPVGSLLVAQPFTKDEYFQPRPSAASYDGTASASSALAVSNYGLRDRVRRLLRRELTTAGYLVQDLEPGESALASAMARPFDAVILDLDAPVAGGPDSIRQVRDVSPVPILALSVRGEEDLMAAALDAGADDCIRKPFGMKELLARLKNALRRRAQEHGNPARVVSGELEIDLLQRRVRLRRRDVHLSPRSYEILRVLVENAGKVVTHAQIVAAIRGSRRVCRIDYLRIAIRELRLKLEADPARARYILTETHIGYRFEVHRSSAQRTPNSTDAHAISR